MSTHAILAPSAAERWMSCPGSIALIVQAPPPPPSIAAQEGTDAHEVAARILLGEQITDHEYKGIEVYIDHVRDRIKRKGAEVWIEKRVWLSEHIHGTPDCVINHRTSLEVVDLKYGYNKVEARGNPQLLIYAAAAIKTYSLNPRNVTLTIAQPRAGGLRSVTVKRKEFEALMQPILRAAEATIAPGAPRRSGNHCQYCPAAPICPERKEEARRLAQLAFSDPLELDNETKIWVHENSKRILKWLEAVNEVNLQAPPPGYRAIAGRGRRVWRTDVEIPMILKAMTLAEAEKAGHNLEALTTLKPGPLQLVKEEINADDFTELQ